MKTFVVQGGVAVVDAGAVVKLTRAQFEARVHNVEVLHEDGEFVVARALKSLQFKVGEQISVEALPRFLSLLKDGFAQTLEMQHQGASPVVAVETAATNVKDQAPGRSSGSQLDRTGSRQSR